MRVVVPYTHRIKRVERALDSSGYLAEWIDVSQSYQRYWYLMAELWGDGDDFCIIEHDVVVDPEVTLQSFDFCEKDWCSCPYPYPQMSAGYYFGLGCTRFRPAIMERHPDAMQVMPEWLGWNKQHKLRHWCRVDGWLKSFLYDRDEGIHPHDMVEHLGDPGGGHGCYKGKPWKDWTDRPAKLGDTLVRSGRVEVLDL